jgi:ubiquinone/menaquinone biosynthesis C-methylase UbiE
VTNRPRHRHTEDHHDWHSAAYVDDWISTDATHDDDRRPLIERMLGLAGLSSDAVLNVLDVGGGYGVVSGVVLRALPNASVTLQDYSEAMLAQARGRLAAYAGRVRYELRDFTEPGWAEGLGGPFDLAVSAIAVHNLGPDGAIPVVYRGVCEMLKPGASFLNLDFPQFAGGLERHLGWLLEAGFARAERAWEVGIQSAMAAYKG